MFTITYSIIPRSSYCLRMALPAAILIALIAPSVSCVRVQRTEPPTVLIAAASDLIKVGQPLASAFEHSTGLRLRFSFSSSGQLEQQIRQGAPFDIYAPASRSFCQSLERDGLVDGEDKVYATGRLVAWSQTLHLHSLNDLKESRVTRVAIANPQYAPYGLAAQQALQAAGLWWAIQPKLIYAETVAQAFQLAETANVDVALVARALVTDAASSFLPVEEKLYRPIEQAAVVLNGSKNKQAAHAFLDFLLTAEAQRILHEYGFGPPQTAPKTSNR